MTSAAIVLPAAFESGATTSAPAFNVARGRLSWRVVAIVTAGYLFVAFLANSDVWLHGVSHTLESTGGADVGQEVWFLAQTPWALVHGHNPLLNNLINAPAGVNLMDNTSMSFAGLLMAPITLLFGPVAAYNVLFDLAFAGSALAFCFMARRLVAWWPAAFVGGLVYGFSPFAFAAGAAHIVWMLNVVPPLLVLCLDRFLRTKSDTPLRSGVLVGACFVAQFYISTEAFSSLVVFTAIGALVLAAYWWRRRPRIDVGLIGRMVVCAAFVTALGIGYGAFISLWGPQHINGPAQPASAIAGLSTDPAGLVLPTLYDHFTFGSTSLANSLVAERTANWQVGYDAPWENGSYIGVPLLLTLVGGAIALRHRRAARFAALIAVVALVLSMGAWLHVDGHRIGIPLPFWPIAHLPLLDSTIAVRWTQYFWLFAAILLALILDSMRNAISSRFAETNRWIGAGAAICFAGAVLWPLVPAWPYAAADTAVPGWFTHQARALPLGADVVVYPFSTPSDASAMIWQAEADYNFRMPGGYALFPSATGSADDSVQITPLETELLACGNGVAAPSIGPESISTQLRQWRTRDVVVVRSAPGAECAIHVLSSALGSPVREGGVALWSVPRQQ